MEALEAIKTRRSIRAFDENKQIGEEKIKELLSCAMHAPSAGGQFPWEFLVIKDRKKIKEFYEFHPHAAMAQTAPLAIVICCDTDKVTKPKTGMLDCSAACQNMLLAAHAQDLGGVWVGLFPKEERIIKTRKEFGMPENIVPLCVNFFGYPEKKPKIVDRYSEKIIHNEKW
jgi:nitroreductase